MSDKAKRYSLVGSYRLFTRKGGGLACVAADDPLPAGTTARTRAIELRALFERALAPPDAAIAGGSAVTASMSKKGIEAIEAERSGGPDGEVIR